MHRNTFLLVLILSVIASLLVGVNVGKKLTPEGQDQPLIETPLPTIPAQQPTLFTNTNCGITLSMPLGTQAEGVASRSARFISADQSVIQFACEREIPRFPVPTGQIESVQISSISATLYHTKSAKDGTPFDALIFRNPTTAMDIYLAGFGSTFSAIIRTIELIK